MSDPNAEPGTHRALHICTCKSLSWGLEGTARRLAALINPANAAETGVFRVNKRWPVGATLTVAFLDGVPDQKKRVQPYFHEWSKYANLKFIFILNKFNADIRVSFRDGEGSWSVVGTDSLLVPKEEPSMVLGWITADTEEDEVRRVTLHEVGHAIGFEHELQSPGRGGVEYDEKKILEYYAQPPYRWPPEETRRQVLDKLNADGLKFTDFDPHSIMCYAVPPEFTKDGKGTPWNRELSPLDKKLAEEIYPW